MSRDSNYTYIHTHASHHADLFEEFCHPPSSTSTTTSTNNVNNPSSSSTTNPQPNTTANNNNNTTPSDPSMITIPGHFLPFEEIQLPPHLMPLNPEDEDDVVPDMHAAFGIQRALGHGNGAAGGAIMEASGEASGRGAARESTWRDLGMERLLESGGGPNDGSAGGVSGSGSANRRGGGQVVVVGRREGVRGGILLMR